MRRFVTLAVLLLFTVPFGISIAGCNKAAAVTYCGVGDSGVRVGQTTAITLQPQVYGISLSYGQKGQISSPSAKDCKGNSTSPTFRYGTTDMTLADVSPTTGALCAGSWNRNSGGGIADFTTCNSTGRSGVAYVTASADATTSNPIPVYIHPVVTSIVLGVPTATANCTTDPDPSTNCSAASSNETTTGLVSYAGTGCLSQGVTGQLAARVYQNGTTNPADNISLQVGHLTYTPVTSSVVTIDENGVATAVAPGSTIVSAAVAGTSSSAGFFSTCPPVSITLTNPGVTSVSQNNTQPLVATVMDTNGVTLTGLNLEYESTTPTTIPAGTSAVTPLYPGAAQITAFCMPPVCNPSPFNQIGLFGNGKPVSSNPVPITSPGTSGTILYIGSTQSQYIVPVDFTTTTLGAPVRLPYVPNSMVISQDGTSIYLGSSTELMVFNASSNALGRESTATPGTVLAVSPDGNTLVISDPVRQVISLVASTGGVTTTYGGVGTTAQWTPDSETVYIAAGNQLLVYSTFTGWKSITQLTAPVSDVAVTVPAVGAYFAGASTTARGYCPASSSTTANGATTVNNVFYPQASDAATATAMTDRLTATNDGRHILGVAAATGTLSDLAVSIPIGSCPTTGGLTFASSLTTTLLPGIRASNISGVVAASDSSVALVTYTGTGGVIPTYAPAASGQGTVGSIKLTGTATAPVAGVFSTDNNTFYAGTSGDNAVHLISRSTLTDTSTVAPKLPDLNGNPATPNLLVQRPRKTTS